MDSIVPKLRFESPKNQDKYEKKKNGRKKGTRWRKRERERKINKSNVEGEKTSASASP